MPIYSQVPVRLQASLISAPPVAPIDANTGLTPAFWRGQAMRVGFAAFDSDGAAVDLSNLVSIQLTIQPSPTSLVPLVTKTVLAADIIPTVSRENWLAGSTQQALFVLSNAQLDLSLNGMDSLPYWLSIVGLTDDNQRIIYLAGYVEVFDAGTVLPPASSGVVSANEQISSGDDFVVNPSAQVHHEEITVNGSAGTRRCIVGVSGLEAGAIVALRFQLPSTAGIIIQIYNQTVPGTLLKTIQTDPDGFTPSARVQLWFDGSDLQRDFTLIPADGQES